MPAECCTGRLPVVTLVTHSTCTFCNELVLCSASKVYMGLCCTEALKTTIGDYAKYSTAYFYIAFRHKCIVNCIPSQHMYDDNNGYDLPYIACTYSLQLTTL
jgi:hypothetical protein